MRELRYDKMRVRIFKDRTGMGEAATLKPTMHVNPPSPFSGAEFPLPSREREWISRGGDGSN
jgi:hypothetical protein